MNLFNLYWKLMKWIIYMMTIFTVIQGSNVNLEIKELLEMVPYERVMYVCVQYSTRDSQVKSLLSYVSGVQFKQNMVDIESSNEFEELASVADTYSIDAYALVNKINSAIEMLPGNNSSSEVEQKDVNYDNEKRKTSLGGTAGLIKDVMQVIPLGEIRQAYRYKLSTNPQFKIFEQRLMKQIFSGEIKGYLQPVIKTRPFQDTIRDLMLLGIPLKEICQFLERTFIDFFDLGTSIETEVQELLEMVPYDRVLEVCMEYAVSDPQIKELLSYLCGDHFKQNVAEMESSNEFKNLAKAARAIHIDAYSLAHKFISALNALPNGKGNFRHPLVTRRRRSPGDGLPGLIRKALEITPLEDMKEAYRYKLENNPQLKLFEQSLMERILSGEVRQYVEPIIKSKPFEETKKDLEEMGLPLEQIQHLIEQKLIEFFDVNKMKTLAQSATTTAIVSSVSE